MLARGGRPVHVPESATHTSTEESAARHQSADRSCCKRLVMAGARARRTCCGARRCTTWKTWRRCSAARTCRTCPTCSRPSGRRCRCPAQRARAAGARSLRLPLLGSHAGRMSAAGGLASCVAAADTSQAAPPVRSHCCRDARYNLLPSSQVEAHCKPRAPAPAPGPGALPLPADLPRERMDFQPARVEDLNGIVPEDVPRLATPQDHSNVRRLAERLHMQGVGGSWEAGMAWLASRRCGAVTCARAHPGGAAGARRGDRGARAAAALPVGHRRGAHVFRHAQRHARLGLLNQVLALAGGRVPVRPPYRGRGGAVRRSWASAKRAGSCAT